MMANVNIINDFHKLYYESYVWRGQTFWLGIPIYKCPLDLWIYQEIIFQIKPDLIIESGTGDGGSAFFLASVCDAVGTGTICTIDIQPSAKIPQHQRIIYLNGSSTSPEILKIIRLLTKGLSKVIVILDSDHTKENVLAELRTYSDFVTSGSYLIVEDTNINNNPVLPDFGPGPMEAVKEFLDERTDFVIDKNCEKLLLTFFPNGFLKKI